MTGGWPRRGIGQQLASLAPRTAIEAGPGPVRAVIAFGPGMPRDVGALLRACRELGQANGAAIGVSELRECARAMPRGAYREALDAATIGRALLREGGAIAYSELGRVPLPGADLRGGRAARSDAGRG